MIAGISGGSIVVTVSFAMDKNSLLSDQQSAVNTVIEGVEAIERRNLNLLESILPSKQSKESFLKLARDFAPDGDFVEQMELTSKTRNVTFTTRRDDPIYRVENPDDEPPTESYSAHIEGVLGSASLDDTTVRISPNKGKPVKVKIEDETTVEITKQYFGDLVRALVRYDITHPDPTLITIDLLNE